LKERRRRACRCSSASGLRVKNEEEWEESGGKGGRVEEEEEEVVEAVWRARSRGLITSLCVLPRSSEVRQTIMVPRLGMGEGREGGREVSL